MELALVLSKFRSKSLNWLFTSLCGSLLISLGSLVQIPTLPVSTTLQTFVIFTLALSLSPKEAVGSVLFYLGWATLGLPVLCGVANPLWFMGASSGYLIAFPFAAYLISFLARRWDSPLGKMGAILCGQSLIYTLGFLFLTPFIGAKAAFIGGVVFFIPTAVLKALFAIGLTTKRG